jgi:hypothetical protein
VSLSDLLVPFVDAVILFHHEYQYQFQYHFHQPLMVPTTGKYGFDIDENDIEIGIGIHGEKGLQRQQMDIRRGNCKL